MLTRTHKYGDYNILLTHTRSQVQDVDESLVYGIYTVRRKSKYKSISPKKTFSADRDQRGCRRARCATVSDGCPSVTYTECSRIILLYMCSSTAAAATDRTSFKYNNNIIPIRRPIWAWYKRDRICAARTNNNNYYHR